MVLIPRPIVVILARNMMDIYPIPGFQEPISSLTHLLAVPIFLVMGYLLVRRSRRQVSYRISLAVMVLCTVFLLSMSGVYHLLGPGTGRFVLKQLDIAGVFALIAGTATPVHAILFKGFSRWAPLLLIWTVATVGITLRSIFADSMSSGGGTVIFLVMGWGGAISCALLWRRFGFEFVAPLLWGGIAYSAGAASILLHRPVIIPGILGPHELWHVAVIMGLAMHWKFIASFAGGLPASSRGCSTSS